MKMIKRTTNETLITLIEQNEMHLNTGIDMINHFLEQFFKQLDKSVSLTCIGDFGIDAHHSLEDLGYVIGRYIKNSYFDKSVERFADVTQLMDECAIQISVDLSGRGFLILEQFEEMVLANYQLTWYEFSEFLHAMVRESCITLHISKIRGENPHHIVEAVFKGLGRVLKQALKENDVITTSTKGKVIWEESA